MAKAGIIFNHDTREMFWILVPMRTRDTNHDDYGAMVGTYLTQEEDEFMGDNWLDNYAMSKILDANFEAVYISDILDQQSHLSDVHRRHLGSILSKYSTLFSGKLGVYPHKKFHIDIDREAVSYHAERMPCRTSTRTRFARNWNTLLS